MKFRFTSVCIIFFFFVQAQKKIVILGSSTAYGIGATPIGNSWAHLYAAHQQTNNSSNTIVNLAIAGFVTYNILPTGTKPPEGRPAPEEKNNITAALAQKPDAIIISLTTNDATSNYLVSETKNNLIKVTDITKAAGIPTYVTTTAPRNLGAEQIKLQIATRDWITTYFGNKSIDFWTGLANPDGTVKSELLYADGIHFNNTGHKILFERVKAKNILEGTILGVKFGTIKAASTSEGIRLEWSVLAENEIDRYELEKSADQISFAKFGQIYSTGNSEKEKKYSWVDKNKSSLLNFYRVSSVSKSGDKVYSNTVLLSPNSTSQEVALYPNPVKNNTVNIHFKNFEAGNYTVTITSLNGQTQQAKELSVLPGTSIVAFPIQRALAPGLYQLRIRGEKINVLKNIFKN